MKKTVTKYLLTWVNEMTGGGGKYFDTYNDAVEYANSIGINFNRHPDNQIIKLAVEV